MAACDEIAADARFVAELRGVIAKLEAEAGPCGREAVVQELSALVPIFGVSKRSEAEWAAFWRAYIDDLADLPLSTLKAGIVTYRRLPTSEFFPKPGPLRALCLGRRAAPAVLALHRARRVLKLAERSPSPAAAIAPSASRAIPTVELRGMR